jgi:hypothetical protein
MSLMPGMPIIGIYRRIQMLVTPQVFTYLPKRPGLVARCPGGQKAGTQRLTLWQSEQSSLDGT